MKKSLNVDNIIIFCCLSLIPVLAFTGLYLIDFSGLSQYRKELYALWMIPCLCILMYGYCLADKMDDDENLKLIGQKNFHSLNQSLNLKQILYSQQKM